MYILAAKLMFDPFVPCFIYHSAGKCCFAALHSGRRSEIASDGVDATIERSKGIAPLYISILTTISKITTATKL
jgi:hypothetical protein